MGNGNARRELLGAGRVVLEIGGRPGPGKLRFEIAGEGRLKVLRQGTRPVLLGRLTGDGCCHDLALHRLDGYRSPIPPLTSQEMRSAGNRPHSYARRLEEAEESPLYDGRWQISTRTWFAPGIWSEDLVTGWPGGSLELYCGGGWHGVLPLRRLSPPGAPRVKAYRKHAREGTLAPVLLWWVPFLDGWLILDGHDRAVAALAEGGTPPCLVLTRLSDVEAWREEAETMTEGHRHLMERLAARPATSSTDRQRAAVDEAYGNAVADVAYEPSYLPSWPLPGGDPAWDALAKAAMFQFPGD
ncbi:hypothetical protein [Streptomyces sp. NPDC047028]|uniref:hypothetical protein n=1 Tax=Streptomyces sp. NPDC047028 TaxID=3155793 RepID=UPI0033CD8171